jgi:hypothetical protein
MPRCPSCGKGGFADHESVARHMSQPRSGCANWTDNLVRLREELIPGPDHDSNIMAVDESSAMQVYEESNGNAGPDDAPVEDLPERSSTTEYFPGAAHAYEGGKMFLERFEADELGKYRTSNIYYPFASRGDWELASWLLCSSLSMNAIDSLLSLDLVRPIVLAHYIHSLTFGLDKILTYLISNGEGTAKTG